MPPRPKHYAGVGLRNLSPTYNYTAPATSTAYAIATGSNRMTQSSMAGVTRSFTYNPVGDITAFTNAAGVANTLAYDPFGRLASHTKSGVTTSYTVNALDQRMAKANAGSTSRYVYAGFNQLLAEQTNGQWSSYIYNGSEPVALVRNNQIYYLHNDHLGRPQLATNTTQQVVWKAANTAFDRTVTQDSIGGLNLGFPGQYLDAESGIWHNGYREYWAETGRYLQSDPIGLAGGINTYGYTSGNPVNMIDPLGLDDVNLILYGAGVTKQMPARNTGRLPDYVKVSFNFYVFNASFVRARNGKVYGATGLNRSWPHSISAGVSASAGYLNQCPKPSSQKLDSFFKGPGVSTTGAYDVVGGAISASPGAGTATEAGVGLGVSFENQATPGSISGDYGYEISNDGWGWGW